MASFSCPTCGKMLKFRQEKAGKSGVCPGCGERIVTPVSSPPDPDASGSVLPTMSSGMRSLIATLALGALLGILLAIASVVPLPGVGIGSSAGFWGLLTAGCCLLLVGTLVYAQATSCPKCGAWCSRACIGKEFVSREVFENEGEPHGRTVYKVTYLCGQCKHRWLVDEAEEYKVSPSGQRRTWTGLER